MAEGSAKRVLVCADAGGVMSRLDLLEQEVRAVKESLERLIGLLDGGATVRPAGAEAAAGETPEAPVAPAPSPAERTALSAEKADLVVEAALGKVLDGIFD